MNKFALLILLCIVIIIPQIRSDTSLFDEFVDDNIGITVDGEHGFLPVTNRPGNEAFYWYIKNKQYDDKAPLFIIIPNGSGKSVLTSYFVSFGAEIFHKKTEKLQSNHFSWNQYADLLLIDIPIGTGFSTYSDSSQIPTTVNQKVKHFYTFLSNFYDKHSDLKDRDIYLVSELRGTQMTPLYALKLAKSGMKMKGLISFANLSNPWIDHLSYAPNLEYKRVMKPGTKKYENIDNLAKFCNLFSI